jgi:hypothetical protein
VVLSSAAEAELAALFYNCKEACSLRTTHKEIGYPQPPTAIGIANDTVKQRRSKAIDMQFYWIADRVKQNQFLIYWKNGSRRLLFQTPLSSSPQGHVLKSPVKRCPPSVYLGVFSLCSSMQSSVASCVRALQTLCESTTDAHIGIPPQIHFLF